jgi:hypothetical protein
MIIFVYFICCLGILTEFSTNNPAIFYAGYTVTLFFLSLSTGGILATAQDLVLPRMRGAALR